MGHIKILNSYSLGIDLVKWLLATITIKTNNNDRTEKDILWPMHHFSILEVK